MVAIHLVAAKIHSAGERYLVAIDGSLGPGLRHCGIHALHVDIVTVEAHLSQTASEVVGNHGILLSGQAFRCFDGLVGHHLERQVPVAHACPRLIVAPQEADHHFPRCKRRVLRGGNGTCGGIVVERERGQFRIVDVCLSFLVVGHQRGIHLVVAILSNLGRQFEGHRRSFQLTLYPRGILNGVWLRDDVADENLAITTEYNIAQGVVHRSVHGAE